MLRLGQVGCLGDVGLKIGRRSLSSWSVSGGGVGDCSGFGRGSISGNEG